MGKSKRGGDKGLFPSPSFRNKDNWLKDWGKEGSRLPSQGKRRVTETIRQPGESVKKKKVIGTGPKKRLAKKNIFNARLNETRPQVKNRTNWVHSRKGSTKG